MSTCTCIPLSSSHQEYMEGLHTHFRDNGVETHMYASQWFLTIYTAKFPIAMVFRVMDVYLCEVQSRDLHKQNFTVFFKIEVIAC